MRTYSRETFLDAKAQWEGGEFGWQWQAIRRIAAERGFIFPPAGSKEDDRDAPNPSQRAVIWRAIVDNPKRLEAIVRRSRSWHDVVNGVIGMEESLRIDADELALDEAWDRKGDPDYREAVTSLGRILGRIQASLPHDPTEAPSR